MNNITTTFKKLAAATLAATLIGVYALTTNVSAIPYTPTSPGTNYPAFNVFTGVPSEGDESDFLRGKEETDPAASVSNVQSACNNGTRYKLRVYVHNAANQTLNADGSGIARNTKVRVALPGQGESSNFNFSSVISASNATSVSDGMTINCANGKKVKLNYVAGSATQFTGYTGTKPLSDTIVTTGAPVGTNQPDGNVLGCFGQRVYVTLIVEVKEVPPPPVSTGVCKLLSLSILNKDEREVRASLSGEVSNATITGYKIDFGDGTTSNQASATHKYAKDGTYTVTGYVTIKFADGHSETKTAPACAKPVKFVPKDCVNNPKTPEDECNPCVDNPNTPANECKPCEDNMNTPENECKPETPPVTPATPTTPSILPNTGPGAIVATFVGVSSLSSGLYYLVRRKFGL